MDLLELRTLVDELKADGDMLKETYRQLDTQCITLRRKVQRLEDRTANIERTVKGNGKDDSRAA